MPQNRAGEKGVSAPSSIRNPFRVGILLATYPGLAAKNAANPGLCYATPLGSKTRICSAEGGPPVLLGGNALSVKCVQR